MQLLFWLFSGFFPRPDLSRLFRVEECWVTSQMPPDVPCYNILHLILSHGAVRVFVRLNVLHSLKHLH